MSAAPPASQSVAPDRAALGRRGALCACGVALAVVGAMHGAAQAGRPLNAPTFQIGASKGAPQIVQAAAEAHPEEPGGALPPVHTAPDVATAAAPEHSAGLADDPLSRLRLPPSASQFDPAQTLKDWAEGVGLLIAFGIVSLWLVRQWVSRQDGGSGPAAHLRTIESLSLPQRCRIHLVDVDGRQVLVAVDASGIKSVTPLPDRFASLLESADGPSQPAVSRLAELETLRHDAWDGRQETRLT